MEDSELPLITEEMQREIDGLSVKLDDFIYIAPVAPATEVRRGVCRYIGPTKFSDGLWVGVELVGSKGKNSGRVFDVFYFNCAPGQGVFVRHELVTPFSKGNVVEIAAAVAAVVSSANNAKHQPTALNASTEISSLRSNEIITSTIMSSSSTVNVDVTTKQQQQPPRPTTVTGDKTLSGKTEIQLLFEIEEYKDRTKQLEEELQKCKDALEAATLDLELSKEEQLLLQQDAQVMKYRLLMAEQQQTTESISTNSEEAALLAVSLQQKAKSAEEENLALKRHLEDMKDHLTAEQNQEKVIESLTERNLELTDAIDAIKLTMNALKKENDELKQVQFLQDEELMLQKEQSDAFAAQLEQLQRMSEDNTDVSNTNLVSLNHKVLSLEAEISRLRSSTRETALKKMYEGAGKAHQAQIAMLTVNHLIRHVGTANLITDSINTTTANDDINTFPVMFKTDTVLLPMISCNGSNNGSSAKKMLHYMANVQCGQITQLLTVEKKEEKDHLLLHVANSGSSSIHQKGEDASTKHLQLRADALTSAITSLFGTITDEANYCEIQDAAQQCVLTMAHCMLGLEDTINVFAQAWSFSTNNMGTTISLSKAFINATEMTIIDVATAIMILYVEVQQVALLIRHPIHREKMIRYARSKREALSGDCSNVDYQNSILGLLKSITHHVTLMTAGTSLQHHLGADRNGLSSTQGCRRMQAVTKALEKLQSELSPYFTGSGAITATASLSSSPAATTTTASDPKQNVLTIATALTEASEYMSWWNSSPEAQAAVALLLRTLIDAARRGYEQTVSTLQHSTTLNDVLGASVDPTTTNENTTNTSPESNSQVLAKRSYFTETLALLNKSSALLKDNFGCVFGIENAESRTLSSMANLRVSPVEVGLAVMLLLRSVHQFGAVLRRAENDVEIGLSPNLADALATQLPRVADSSEADASRDRLHMFMNAMTSLEGISIRSDSTDGDGAVEWSCARSLTINYVVTAHTGSTSRTLGFLVSPLVRAVGLIAGNSSKARGVSVDDLQHSSVATLASLFVYGGLRKDVNTYITGEGGYTAPVAATHGEPLLRILTSNANTYFGVLGSTNDEDKNKDADALQEMVTKLEKELAVKKTECEELIAQLQELEVTLFEAVAEKSGNQMLQQQLEDLRRAVEVEKEHHKVELAKQEKEWSEAYDKVNKTKNHYSQELRILRTEEKLSPLSAQERVQHQLLLSYFSALVSQVLVGGGGLGVIGIGRFNNDLQKEIAYRSAKRSEEENDKLMAALLSQTTSAAVSLPPDDKPLLVSSCSAACDISGSDIIFGGPVFSRNTQSVLSTMDAARMLDIVQRRSSKGATHRMNTSDGGEETQPSARTPSRQTPRGTNTTSSSQLSLSTQQQSYQLYVTKLPKIRRFTDKEECRKARLGVLLGQ